EALNNAAKHASPSETSVIIRGTDKGTLLILITDDGTGMEAEQLSEENGISGSEHFGIKGMRERVESMHGTIGFNSTPGEGTEVRIELPLQQVIP
ncbi:MAG: ATP-binding protein, partial [Treponema sp.]|nr:ATP-binding protein [Treponema sp.]